MFDAGGNLVALDSACRFAIQTKGATPPRKNITPPTARIHVRVWNVLPSMKAWLRACTMPPSSTAMNCRMPAGSVSSTTIRARPMFKDQNDTRTSGAFQRSALIIRRPQKSTAAMERLP